MALSLFHELLQFGGDHLLIATELLDALLLCPNQFLGAGKIAGRAIALPHQFPHLLFPFFTQLSQFRCTLGSLAFISLTG